MPAALVAHSADEAQATAPAIQVNVDRILVPVVVRDKNGRTFSGLKQEDFKVFDNDKPRAIVGFLEERRGAERAGNPGASGSLQQTQPSDSQGLPSRIIVFLFDDLHLSFEDIAYAQKAASKVVDGLGSSDLAAVVSTSGRINSGLTRDSAKLREALTAIRPEGIYRTDLSDCPRIDYYQADLIENKNDVPALQDAVTQVMTVCNPNLPANLAEMNVHSSARRALNLGSLDVKATYSSTSEFVRRIAKMPGERTLVLVSSGFPPIEEESRILESRLINLAAQSGVAINAIDARGLYGTSLTASEDMRSRDPALVADYRRASMKLAEDSMGELADGTGGMFFHNNNDLDAGFKKLTDAPDTVYLLELSLDSIKMDGTYHRLKVKLNQDGLDLNARRGYFAPRAKKDNK
jgi:VWFA-related protein